MDIISLDVLARYVSFCILDLTADFDIREKRIRWSHASCSKGERERESARERKRKRERCLEGLRKGE
jgi:hypothetical protein